MTTTNGIVLVLTKRTNESVIQGISIPAEAKTLCSPHDSMERELERAQPFVTVDRRHPPEHT
jgi:hypothetical protein